MKAAYATVFQVRDGICYGAFLSAGRRVQHECGIEELARRLSLRRCPGGMLISCDRDPERAFFLGTADIDGEPSALFELEGRWAETRRKRVPSPAAVKRRIQALHEAPVSEEETPVKEATTRGFWDTDRFAITTRGAIGVAYLETLYLAALAGDLAPTYFDIVPGDVSSERHEGLSDIGAGLGLFAAGLAPPDVRSRIVEHQTRYGFKGREIWPAWPSGPWSSPD